MALNTFKLKKYAAVLMSGCIPAVLLSVGTASYGMIWGGIGFFMAGLLLILPLHHFLMRNPFSQMLEGSGLLALNLDSTGVIQPFVMGVKPPYMGGKLGKKEVVDVFDREAVSHLAVPKKAVNKAEGQPDGGIKIELTEKELNEGRFALFHFPVVLYNAQTQTVITKDWLGEKEKTAFAEHSILYLNRRIEELTSNIRDFGRYVVENLRPSKSIFGRWWVWVILAVFIIIMLVLFGQPILDAIRGFTGVTGEALGSAGGGDAVTPR